MIHAIGFATLLAFSSPAAITPTVPLGRAALVRQQQTVSGPGPKSAMWAAAEDVVRYQDDPVAFVREVFGVEPDAWQIEVLEVLPTEPRIAMKACKGPGKSALLAWAVWWFLSLHEDAEVLCCSITKKNLEDNLWKELAKWHQKSSWLRLAFHVQSEHIRNRERPKTWFVSARAFPKRANKSEQENTLAGHHSEHVAIVLDEVGDYPHGVLAAADGIFANVVDAHLWVAGNPTNVHGPLYKIATVEAGKTNPETGRPWWYLVTITGDPDDPKRSSRISLVWATALCHDPGRNDPWVKVNVLGEFPPAGSMQLIGVEAVLAAQKRDASPLAWQDDPIVWGLDPARHGMNKSALMRRQGLMSWRPHRWRNLNGPGLAAQVAKLLLQCEKRGKGMPDAIFIDGGGIGSSCVDHLELLQWGHLVHEVQFGGNAIEKGRYADKRTEMWAEMKYWTEDKPSCLPDDATLRGGMTAPDYEYKIMQKRTVMKLQSKEELEDEEGNVELDEADALALTFAEPVAPRSNKQWMLDTIEQRRHGRAAVDEDVLGEKIDADGPGRVLTEYDPFSR